MGLYRPLPGLTPDPQYKKALLVNEAAKPSSKEHHQHTHYDVVYTYEVFGSFEEQSLINAEYSYPFGGGCPTIKRSYRFPDPDAVAALEQCADEDYPSEPEWDICNDIDPENEDATLQSLSRKKTACGVLEVVVTYQDPGCQECTGWEITYPYCGDTSFPRMVHTMMVDRGVCDEGELPSLEEYAEPPLTGFAASDWTSENPIGKWHLPWGTGSGGNGNVGDDGTDGSGENGGITSEGPVLVSQSLSSVASAPCKMKRVAVYERVPGKQVPERGLHKGACPTTTTVKQVVPKGTAPDQCLEDVRETARLIDSRVVPASNGFAYAIKITKYLDDDWPILTDLRQDVETREKITRTRQVLHKLDAEAEFDAVFQECEWQARVTPIDCCRVTLAKDHLPVDGTSYDVCRYIDYTFPTLMFETDYRYVAGQIKRPQWSVRTASDGGKERIPILDANGEQVETVESFAEMHPRLREGWREKIPVRVTVGFHCDKPEPPDIFRIEPTSVYWNPPWFVLPVQLRNVLVNDFSATPWQSNTDNLDTKFGFLESRYSPPQLSSPTTDAYLQLVADGTEVVIALSLIHI